MIFPHIFKVNPGNQPRPALKTDASGDTQAAACVAPEHPPCNTAMNMGDWSKKATNIGVYIYYVYIV